MKNSKKVLQSVLTKKARALAKNKGGKYVGHSFDKTNSVLTVHYCKKGFGSVLGQLRYTSTVLQFINRKAQKQGGV